MLWYKAWMESRFRFVAGVLSITALSILYVRLHPVLIPQWIGASRDPLLWKPAWLPLGISDYQFYIWHFVFDYQLQWLWVLFVVLLSFGGLVREQAQGTSTYSLGLPVTRRRWLLTRAALAFFSKLCTRTGSCIYYSVGLAHRRTGIFDRSRYRPFITLDMRWLTLHRAVYIYFYCGEGRVVGSCDNYLLVRTALSVCARVRARGGP